MFVVICQVKVLTAALSTLMYGVSRLDRIVDAAVLITAIFLAVFGHIVVELRRVHGKLTELLRPRLLWWYLLNWVNDFLFQCSLI
jgi:hypothetical protein